MPGIIIDAENGVLNLCTIAGQNDSKAWDEMFSSQAFLSSIMFDSLVSLSILQIPFALPRSQRMLESAEAEYGQGLLPRGEGCLCRGH